MRMLLTISIPHEPFNSLVRKGTVGETIGRILEDQKPEAVYFTEENGRRQAVLVVHVERASDVPAFAEPWFLVFNADCRFRIVMSIGDLQAARLDELGRQWVA